MTRQADVAYANLQATKKVTPKSEKSAKESVPKVTETSKKSEPPRNESKPLQLGKEKSDADFAAENERLAQEIAAAQAVLAQLKPNVKPKGSKNEKSTSPPKPVRAVSESPKTTPSSVNGKKKRAGPPPGAKSVQIAPNKEKSQYKADGEGNFMPEREGYVNDVIVEGKIITEGGILHKIGTKKHNEGSRVSFHNSAEEVTYPSESASQQLWDEQHPREVFERMSAPQQSKTPPSYSSLYKNGASSSANSNSSDTDSTSTLGEGDRALLEEVTKDNPILVV